MSWEEIQALLAAINKVFGVAPLSFFLVSLAGTFLLAGLRAALKTKKFTTQWWYKPVLTASATAVGIGLAFLAWTTPLYNTVPNAATIAFLGIFNGLLAMGCWQLVKYVPKVSEMITGTARVTLPPPAPAEKPKEETPEGDAEAEEEGAEAADESADSNTEDADEDKPEEG